MTCEQARRLLAAYRRDDWSPAQLEALGQHLAGCAECRRVEASYRTVGESIRQLPSIQPPDTLRSAVFAAIRAEEARRARTLEQIASDVTQPGIPALGRTAARGRTPRRPLVLGARTAMAVAAMLLLALFGARLAPLASRGLPSAVARLATAIPYALSGSAGPHVDHYAADPGAGQITQALASSAWLAYVGTDQSGRSMLYVEDRASGRSMALLASPSTAPITVRAVSDHWIIWLSGDGLANAPWTLWASPLPTAPRSGSVGQPIALVSSAASAVSPSAPALLAGVWANGDAVLVASASHAGNAMIARLDLAEGQSAPASQVLAQAQAPGHLLTDPSQMGESYYWAEVWSDASGLHSQIWQGDGSSRLHQVTPRTDAFAPHATGHSLIWVQPHSAVFPDLSATQPQQAAQLALAQLRGSIHVQDLASGQSWQMTPESAASSLEVAGALVIWRIGSQTHTYDLAHNGPSPVEGLLRSAAYAGANGTSLAWGASGSRTIDVYDAR